MLLSTLLSTVLLPLAPSFCPQTAEVRIRQGDPLPSGDLVTRIVNVRIDDEGTWFATLDTDADVSEDLFLVRDGSVLLREGASLPQPAGALFDGLELLTTGRPGDAVSSLRVELAPGILRRGLYFNDTLLALTGDPVGAPEVPAGTSWDSVPGFRGLRLNRTRTLLVTGSINNPEVNGAREDALVRFQLDEQGQLVSTNVLLTKGQFVPALGGVILTLAPLDSSIALNDHGDFLCTVSLGNGGPDAILKNGETALARSGDPSPVPGRSYRTFNVTSVALNDLGEFAFGVLLDGPTNDRALLVKNGQKVAQQGDALPFLPSPIGDSVLRPIQLSNSGDLFWIAADASYEKAAFVRNQEVILQAQGSVVEGHLVTAIAVDGRAQAVSPDGRFWAGRVELQNVGEALVTADFGLAVPVPGCTGNGARLSKSGGDVRVGQHVTFALDNAQALGAIPALFFGARSLGMGGCGLPISGGELLVDPTSTIAVLVGAPWTGSPVSFSVDIPASLALVDRELFGQGAFVAPSGTARRLLLSNGLRLEVGAP